MAFNLTSSGRSVVHFAMSIPPPFPRLYDSVQLDVAQNQPNVHAAPEQMRRKKIKNQTQTRNRMTRSRRNRTRTLQKKGPKGRVVMEGPPMLVMTGRVVTKWIPGLR